MKYLTPADWNLVPPGWGEGLTPDETVEVFTAQFGPPSGDDEISKHPGPDGGDKHSTGSGQKVHGSIFTSEEVDAANKGLSTHMDDFPDREWQLVRVKTEEINHWRVEDNHQPTPLTGEESPVVLIPNTRKSFQDGVRPGAKWFAEDGRRRVLAAKKFGVERIDAFVLMGADNPYYDN